MSTDWHQIWSENVNRLTFAVPFCFHSVDKICSYNKTADWHQKIKQNLLTELDDRLAAEIQQTLLLL